MALREAHELRGRRALAERYEWLLAAPGPGSYLLWRVAVEVGDGHVDVAVEGPLARLWASCHASACAAKVVLWDQVVLGSSSPEAADAILDAAQQILSRPDAVVVAESRG